MPVAPVNGIEIFYDVHGDPADPALVLVTGISVQMIWWWDRFVERLVDRGFFVVRHDNRDSGLSTRFDHVDPMAALTGALAGNGAPYTLSDLANDTIALLDHLGIDTAHFVGQSMGGMIVQTIALEHRERVRTLASIGSNTGGVTDDPPPLESLAKLVYDKPVVDRETGGDAYVHTWTLLAGPGYPCDPGPTREVGMRAHDRGPTGLGVLRHLAAIAASGDRTERLAALKVPTLVIHGDADPLVDVSGGYATAKAIPGAELHIVEGLGHDIPEVLWDQFIDLIDANTERENDT